MAVHRNENLYRNAFLAGCVGFITYGWDAGVLGGILLTDAFQSAMGVSSSGASDLEIEDAGMLILCSIRAKIVPLSFQ